MRDTESNHEHELIVNVLDIPAGVFTVDAQQRIVAWNAGAERLLGYRREEVLGRVCSEVLGIGQPTHSRLCDAHCVLLSRPSRAIPAAEVCVTARGGEPQRVVLSTLTARSGGGQARLVHILHTLPPDPARSADPAPARELNPHASDQSVIALDYEPEPHLTPRELEVLRLLAGGMATADIAVSLGISRITARNHVTKLIDKLQVRTRLQAVVAASRLGLI
jgi:DNA-binding CsgD family transcriptional regulator